MILAAFFILGFGLCAAENIKLEETNPNTTYKNALKAVQMEENLHLLWLSKGLMLTECVVSKFLNKTDHGAQRTIEMNFKVNQSSTESSRYQQAKGNMTITVHRAPHFSYLDVRNDGGDVPQLLTGHKDLLNATKKCVVLEARIQQYRKVFCVVFGPRNSGKKCLKYAKDNCASGDEVDLSQCDVPPIKAMKPQA
uniref:Putative secreted protein 94 n=1 Tax=Amblyomma cajennense TaxID=34607 RepID=A0A023FFI0_AMBCJ